MLSEKEKKELLAEALEDAVNTLTPNSFEEFGLADDVLITSIKAFAEHNEVEFTDEEIREAVDEKLEELDRSKEDFLFQDKITE